MIRHTTIVFVRYILLEWIHRNEDDERSYGELIFMFCNDIQETDLTNALQRLMALFVNITQTFSSAITDMIKNQVCNWMASQAGLIQALCSDLCRENWVRNKKTKHQPAFICIGIMFCLFFMGCSGKMHTYRN